MRITELDYFGPTLNFLASADNALCFSSALVTEIEKRFVVSVDSAAAFCMG
jgi:hypothetical protein